MLNRLHHELLISYYKDQLNKLPFGNVGCHKGIPVVYISKDPADPSISYRNKKCYQISSKKGKIYYELIQESIRIRAKIKELEEEWDSIYKIKPREIRYPLRHKTGSLLDKDLYFKSRSGQNLVENDRPIEYKGHMLRSKNELLACQAIEQLGYDYKTEIKIESDKFKSFYPDVTIYLHLVEKPLALEVDGALDQESYFRKSELRKKNYFDAGLLEFKDVIFYRLNDGYSFDVSRLKALIDAALLTNMDDIIIPDD